MGVCPLIDNKIEDRYLYEVTVKTGTRINAGTKSNVFFKLIGMLNLDLSSTQNQRRIHNPVKV